MQRRSVLGLACAVWGLGSTAGAEPQAVSSRRFRASDSVSLHYLQAGQGPRAVVFVPGWLMPAEIFRHQLAALSADHRVIVLDPRGQGRSQVRVRDMSAKRRADDIHELVRHLKLDDIVLVGWSLGVMELLETITRHRMPGLKGLVLVDNSIGMGTPPAGRRTARPMKREAFGRYVSEFSRAIFKRPPEDGLVEVVERSARQLEPAVAWQLLDKPHHRDYYRHAVLATEVPLWYAVTPRFAAQGRELRELRPDAEVTVFEDAGHALFVDDAQAFNEGMRQFLGRLP